MSDRPPGVWSFLNSAAVLWTIGISVIGGLISLVGAYYGLDNRVTDLQGEQTQMSAQNLSSRVQTLEDARANDVASFNSQVQSLQTQVQSLQSEEHDDGLQLSSIAQNVALISGQIGIIINRTLPGGPATQGR